MQKISFLKSIYVKLILLFALIGVIPLIVGSFYSYSSDRNALLQAALKEQDIEILPWRDISKFSEKA